ncbi:MAG TPA: hypothetical protein PKE30_08990 [Niabella sp.]|nr:hypothetical protein [Niabella sp.]
MDNDIFKGIEKSEIEAFGNRLGKERELGNRFAAIQIKGDNLLEKDIGFYKTPFEATKHIFMAPTANGFYMLCSMSSLEKDVKHILEGKVIEIEQKAAMKQSKGFDMER